MFAISNLTYVWLLFLLLLFLCKGKIYLSISSLDEPQIKWKHAIMHNLPIQSKWCNEVSYNWWLLRENCRVGGKNLPWTVIRYMTNKQFFLLFFFFKWKNICMSYMWYKQVQWRLIVDLHLVDLLCLKIMWTGSG